MKRTKQGVRDLNSLPAKPRGIRLEMPPETGLVCAHTRTRTSSVSGDILCLDCPAIWDWNGEPY